MKCASCGFENAEDAQVCVQCGSHLKPASPSEVKPHLSGLQTVYADPSIDKPSPSLQFEPGTIIAERYKVDAMIGAGGMGAVYRAHDKLTDRQIALKMIKPEQFAGQSDVNRLIQEGITARDIRHANVVSVYDVGQAGGVPFVIMELLNGQTLRQWHRQQLYDDVVDLPLSTVQNIMIGIIDGLTEAHRAGVIHRDLKPENIMLVGDPAQSSASVKILDFGLARATQNRSQHFSGSTAGTMSYIAPEQITHPGLETESADIFALSKIFYELLVGTLPEGHWQAPSEFRDDVPSEIDNLIRRGLSVRATNRPNTSELRQNLIAVQLKANQSSRKIPKIKTRAAKGFSITMLPKLDLPRLFGSGNSRRTILYSVGGGSLFVALMSGLLFDVPKRLEVAYYGLPYDELCRSVPLVTDYEYCIERTYKKLSGTWYITENESLTARVYPQGDYEVTFPTGMVITGTLRGKSSAGYVDVDENGKQKLFWNIKIDRFNCYADVVTPDDDTTRRLHINRKPNERCSGEELIKLLDE